MKKTKTIFAFLLSASFFLLSVGLFGQTEAQTRKKTVKEDDLLKTTGQAKTFFDEYIRAPRAQTTPTYTRAISWEPDRSSHLTLRKALSKNSSTKNR